MRMRAYQFFVLALVICFFSAQTLHFIEFILILPLVQHYPQMRDSAAFIPSVQSLRWIVDALAALIAARVGYYVLGNRVGFFITALLPAFLYAWLAGFANISGHLSWLGVLQFPVNFWIIVATGGFAIFHLVNWIDAVTFFAFAIIIFVLLMKLKGSETI